MKVNNAIVMDAIWEEPAVQDSQNRVEKCRSIDVVDIEDDGDAPQRPKKRARQALFYTDSDDDIPGPSNMEPVLEAPPSHDIDIDALFAGVDDDDDEISRPLPAILDEDELARQAEARFKRNPPPLTPHEILPSSSPARAQERKSGKQRQEKGKDDEKKGRRRQLKLDENLLLSPTGFPQLVKMTKDFRTKGKGHEVVDLDRLLRIYQYWTHQLYPKTTFTDTVERVEKLCHSRRMNVALSVWRDEAHGKFTNHVDIDEGLESGDEDEPTRDKDQSMEVDDLTHAPLARSSSPILLHDDVDHHAPPTTRNHNPEDDDAELWNIIDAGMEASLSDIPSAPPTSGPNSSMDESEDIWNIVNEVEKEALGTAASSAEVAVASGPLPQGHTRDDDWDDMYV